MTEQKKRGPGRPKKVAVVESVEDSVKADHPARAEAEKSEPPLPVPTAPQSGGITGHKVSPRRVVEDPKLHEGSRPNALQRALGTQPVVYYMGPASVQIKPTFSSVVQLGDGTYARQVADGFKLKRENKTLPFSEPFDPILDADKIALIEAYRKENHRLHSKVGLELYPWDGGKLAPPIDRWDHLNAEAIKRVILAGAVDAAKCMKYELQKPIRRQDVIDVIEEANAELQAEAEAAKVEAEIVEAREREAHVAAVAV